MKLPNKIGIDNSMICNDIWHKYHKQEGGSVSRVNIGRLITTSVTSRHTSMFFKMAGNFLVRHFCKR